MEQFAVEIPNSGVVAEWERLADQTEASPFQRPGWVCAWVDSFADPDDLRLATVRQDGDLVAVLPLRRRGRWLASPVNLESPRFDAVARDAAAARRLCTGLVELTRRSIELTYLPEEGVLMTALEDVAAETGRRMLRQPVRSQVQIDTSGRWEDYAASQLSTHHRKQARKKTRRLLESGRLDLDVQEGRVGLAEFLEEGLALEASGWKGAAGTAVLSRPPSRVFYRQVAQWAAAAGTLRLAFLRLDGRPIAFSLGLEQGGVHYDLKLAYDEEFGRFSPGDLILLRLVERNFQLPELRVFDLCGGADDYKRTFATGSTGQVRVHLLRSGISGSVDRRTAMARITARKALLEHVPPAARPWLVKAATRVGVR